MKFEISIPEIMENLGQGCSTCCETGVQIFLRGDLGAGKTTFVRGFLRGLGYAGKVKSPTYTLIEPYNLARFTVYHFDLYRLTDPLELEAIGGRDYFDGSGVCLVEWPEKASTYLGEPDLMVDIGYLDEKREVYLKDNSVLGKQILTGLEDFQAEY